MPITVDACAAQHQGDRKEQQDRVAILSHARQRGVALAQPESCPKNDAIIPSASAGILSPIRCRRSTTSA